MSIEEQFVTPVVLDTAGQVENLKGIITVDPTRSVACAAVSSDRLLHIQIADIKVSIILSDLEEILKRASNRPSASLYYPSGTKKGECELPSLGESRQGTLHSEDFPIRAIGSDRSLWQSDPFEGRTGSNT